MNLLAHLLSPETMRIVALTLLHFLWQGAALAAVAYVSLSLVRNSSTRYAFLVGLLALMLASPVATFLILNSQATTTALTASPALSEPRRLRRTRSQPNISRRFLPEPRLIISFCSLNCGSLVWCCSAFAPPAAFFLWCGCAGRNRRRFRGIF